MTESQPTEGDHDPAEHEKGSLDPAPATPTDEDSGTGRADKRNDDEGADEPSTGPADPPGAEGGEITR